MLGHRIDEALGTSVYVSCIFVLQTVSQQSSLYVLPALASQVAVQCIINQSNTSDSKGLTVVKTTSAQTLEMSDETIKNS